MSNPQTSAVKSAAQALRQAGELHARVAEKLASAAAATPEVDLAPLELALQDAAASHALGLVDLAAVDAARKTLADARAESDRTRSERFAAQALAHGLSRRLDASQADVQAARTALADAKLAWLVADQAAAEAAYLLAAEAATEALSRHAAGHRAMQALDPETVLRRTHSSMPVLPTLGALTRAAVAARRPGLDGWGVNLLDVLAPGHIDVEGDLVALTDARPIGLMSALKRAVRA